MYVDEGSEEAGGGYGDICSARSLPKEHEDKVRSPSAIKIETIKKILFNDTEYPEQLRHIYDAPKELYIKGNIELLSSNCIAIVGTRRATEYGLSFTRKLAFDLSRAGFTIVSGLADGIDTEAHKGALDSNSPTIAVFGCGLDNIFPISNYHLAKNILVKGAHVSEYQEGVSPAKWTFPKRNRIVAGLCCGVIIIEGDVTSGAMITAKLALDEGRDVFAVPGRVDLESSRGPNWLIKQGAKLIESANDVLEEYGMLPMSDNSKRFDMGQLTIEEVSIFEKLSRSPKSFDVLCCEAAINAQELSSRLMLLELKGAVKRLAGNSFVTS